MVVAKGATGNTSLATEPENAGFTTHSIGDCTGITYLEGATEAATELAVRI